MLTEIRQLLKESTRQIEPFDGWPYAEEVIKTA